LNMTMWLYHIFQSILKCCVFDLFWVVLMMAILAINHKSVKK